MNGKGIFQGKNFHFMVTYYYAIRVETKTRDDNGAKKPRAFDSSQLPSDFFGLVCNLYTPHQKDGPPKPYSTLILRPRRTLGPKVLVRKLGGPCVHLPIPFISLFVPISPICMGSPTITMPRLLHLLLASRYPTLEPQNRTRWSNNDVLTNGCMKISHDVAHDASLARDFLF